MGSVAIAGCLLAIAPTGPSAAQPVDPFEAARTVKFDQAEPFATVRALGAWGSPAEVLSFYLYWDKPYGVAGRKRGFAVRRFSHALDAQPRLHWATSHECPAIEPLLLRMEKITAPRIDVPGLGRDDRVLPPMDGVTYELWSRWPTWPKSHAYALRMSSNVGSPLADWVEAARRDLERCWSEAVPPAGEPRGARP